MSKPFERFTSELSWQQVSLLLDTVLYFEDAPKLLSIPDLEQSPIPVPFLPDTLRVILGELPEDEPFVSKRFSFDWISTSNKESIGEVVVELPGGEIVRQPTQHNLFSPM